jgi:hypothetical protein
MNDKMQLIESLLSLHILASTRRALKKELRTIQERTCSICNKTFFATHGNQVYCSLVCANKQRNRQYYHSEGRRILDAWQEGLNAVRREGNS